MTKCITLSDDAYNSLKSLKNDEESFSDIVRKLAVKKKSEMILSLAGIWKDNSRVSNIMKEIYKDRKNFKLRGV